MPTASYSARRQITDLEEAAAILRDNGLRVSASRRIVLAGLLGADGPISAERLATAARPGAPSCDLPSVYRNLDLLERLGMVRHVHIGHGPGLYALVSDQDPTYLVCERCGRIDELPAACVDEVRARIGAATDFEAHFTHFPILGLCGRCTSEVRTQTER